MPSAYFACFLAHANQLYAAHVPDGAAPQRVARRTTGTTVYIGAAARNRQFETPAPPQTHLQRHEQQQPVSGPRAHAGGRLWARPALEASGRSPCRAMVQFLCRLRQVETEVHGPAAQQPQQDQQQRFIALPLRHRLGAAHCHSAPQEASADANWLAWPAGRLAQPLPAKLHRRRRRHRC